MRKLKFRCAKCNGKLVADFEYYGTDKIMYFKCINCGHIIEELMDYHRKYGPSVPVGRRGRRSKNS